MTDAATPTDMDYRRDACAAMWNLTIGDQLDGGYLAHVYECRDPEGRDLVLKLSPPIARPALEAAALAAWDGHGAARLVAFDPQAGALLLDRIRPGTSLRGANGSEPLLAAADTLRSLHSTRPDLAEVPAFAEWLDWFFERVMMDAEPGTVGVAMLPKLRQAAERLAETATLTTLVHGDFCPKNVLLAETGSYVAIDPMPYAGDPCSDVGLFAVSTAPASSAPQRAAQLGELAALDPDRCARWAAVWAIGEACETWRDDSHDLQEWVSAPECAALLAM